MKTSTAIIFVLLFAFAAIANAQTNSTTNSTSVDDNPVAKCIKDKNCGSDMSCIAKCAGVPDPSPKDANDTNTCVSKCNQSDPVPTYQACVKNCVDTIYQPTGDSGSSSNPSGSAAPSGSASATKSGSSPSSSSSASPSGNSTKSAAQSLDARIAFSNSLSMMATLLLVCVVAKMTNVGF